MLNTGEEPALQSEKGAGRKPDRCLPQKFWQKGWIKFSPKVRRGGAIRAGRVDLFGPSGGESGHDRFTAG